MANIFEIDWDNVIENLTPHFWRTSKLLAYLRSMIQPVQDISDDLLDLQNETTAFLSYTGQHLALEAYLNDTYDITLRRIFITENDIAAVDPISIYLSGESTSAPLELYLSGEAAIAPVGIYLSDEGVVSDNFTVHLPSAIVYDADTITAQLRNYVEASKNWDIVTF